MLMKSTTGRFFRRSGKVDANIRSRPLRLQGTKIDKIMFLEQQQQQQQ